MLYFLEPSLSNFITKYFVIPPTKAAESANIILVFREEYRNFVVGNLIFGKYFLFLNLFLNFFINFIICLSVLFLNPKKVPPLANVEMIFPKFSLEILYLFIEFFNSSCLIILFSAR